MAQRKGVSTTGASKPVGRRGESAEEALARYTPFGQALQRWLWTGRGYGKPSWSRRRLAQELEGVSLGAVDSWFSRGTRPEPQAFWELVRVTGWEPDYLRQLAGYDEMPPQVQGPWAFAREHAQERWSYDAARLADVLQWLTDVQREYERKPKRPTQHRKKAQQDTSQETSQDTSQGTPRKEHVNAGK